MGRAGLIGGIVRVVARRSGGRSAPATPVPPADAPVVASVPGATLVAFDHAGKLCIGLSTEEPASCDAPPHGLFDPHVEGSSSNATWVVYGVTSTDAVSVEVLAPGKRVAGPVSGGAYAGRFAGRARFFVVAVSGDPYRVLLRDAAGRVLAGTDFGSTPAVGRPIDPPEVAALRLTLDSGAPITVATTDLLGYTGRSSRRRAPHGGWSSSRKLAGFAS
jgi:hypothetical protein